jgi:HEAT repeat protein
MVLDREPQGVEESLIQNERDAGLLRVLRSQGQATHVALRPLLSAESRRLRAKAVRLAYELSDPAIIAIASEKTRDAEPSVRRVAVTVLGRTGGASEVPAILSLVDDRDNGVRKAVHDSLVSIGPKAIASLEAAVAGGQSPADVAAARALTALGDPGIAALAHSRPASIAPLLAALRRHASKETIAAVHDVAAPEAVAQLAAALPDELVRGSREGPLAVELLRQLVQMPPSAANPRPLDAASAWPALLDYLQDPCDPLHFEPAARVLAFMREARAVDALASALRVHTCRGWSKGNVPVAEAAAHALGAIGGPRAIPPLIATVDDTEIDSITRRAAAKSLHILGDPAGIAAANRYLAAPLSKLSVVKRRIPVPTALLLLGSVIVALAVRTGLELAFHRTYLLLCAWAEGFVAWPATNSIPSGMPLAMLPLGALLALSLALRYWFGRPRTASAFGAAAARELAYGVYAAFGGIVLVIVIEIVGAIRFFYS